jgi:hypothetical protein
VTTQIDDAAFNDRAERRCVTGVEAD